MFFESDILINILSSTYQIGVFLYAVSRCLKEERKKDAVRWIESFFILMTIELILSILFDGYAIITIETHSIGFFLVCGTVYRERLHDAMVAYSLCYYECLIYSITKYVLFGQDVELTIGTSLSAIVVMIIYFWGVKSIVEVYDNIKGEKQYRLLVIVFSFVADIFLVFDDISIKSETRALQLIIFKVFVVFLIMNILYFAVRYYKVKKITKLNSKLNYYNNELKNIKDYHEKIIDNMYKLYKSGSNEEIGKMLKDIINNTNKEPNCIKTNSKENNSILNIALMQAVKDGINVNIDEEYSLELVDIDKMELYRIISNIINNARRFVGIGGIINAKTYKEKDRVIIIIENNGPKIESDKLDKIFMAGFTTKNNHDRSHGYGLNIVKELIEKNNGYIEVSSTNLITSFKISLPCD